MHVFCLLTSRINSFWHTLNAHCFVNYTFTQVRVGERYVPLTSAMYADIVAKAPQSKM